MDAPAVIVHSLGQAVAVLNDIPEGDGGVLLLSPPDASSYMGASVFKAMVDQAHEAMPDSAFVAALDCGDDAGHALTAIREGIRAIVLSDSCPAYARVIEIAKENGVNVLSPAVYENLDQDEPMTTSLPSEHRTEA